MKKGLAMMAAALTAAAALTGCTSIETAEKFNSLPVGESSRTPPVAHVNVRINGFYLFGVVPIFCGSISSSGKSSAFMDTVTTENAVLLLTRTGRGMGGNRVYDINTYHRTSGLMPLFSFDTVEASGTFVK